MESRQLLTAFVVTTASDSGQGSLRQAIIDANATPNPSSIDFNIGSGGNQSILPVTPLPALANSITIDGTTQPGYNGTPIIQISGSQIKNPNSTSTASNGLQISAGNCTIRGLVINLFNGNGIDVEGGGKNIIVGNYIGTDLSGQVSFPNTQDGIYMFNSRNNRIGGTTIADGNLVSGNGGGGIDILSSGNNVVGGNVIQGNEIGTDSSGQGPLGNTYDGITLNSTSSTLVGGTTPGAANIIAFNGGDGVKVGNYYASGSQELYNSILSNSITSNGNLGIDLQYGANSPVFDAALTSAYLSNDKTVIEGSFAGTPDTTFTLQFFSNVVQNYSEAGEGKAFIGTATVTTDSVGNAQFTANLPIAINTGNALSATATSNAGSTSAFFQNTLVTQDPSSDLGVSQYSDAPPAYIGATYTYMINVANNGPSRSDGVTLTDQLPDGATIGNITTTQGTFTSTNGVVNFNLGTLSSGQIVVIAIDVVPSLLGNATNTLTVQGSPNDPDLSNNTSKLVIAVAPSPYPPYVVNVQPTVGLRSIKNLIVQFNVPLNPSQAVSPINYQVVAANARGRFTRVVPINAPAYDAASQTVTLTPTKPFHLGTLYELQIDGQGSAGVTDLGGNLLMGNTADGPLGPYFLQFSRGYVSPGVSGGIHYHARSLTADRVSAQKTHR